MKRSCMKLVVGQYNCNDARLAELDRALNVRWMGRALSCIQDKSGGRTACVTVGGTEGSCYRQICHIGREALV